MRKLLLPLSIAVCCTISCKKNDGDQPPPIPNNQALTWAKSYGGSGFDFANAAIQLSGGDYIVAGTSRSTDGDLSGSRIGFDYWLTRIGTDGSKQWSVAFGNNTFDEHATAVAASSDGNIFLTGYAFSTPNNYAWVLKTNGSGAKLWEKQISASSDAEPLAVVATSDGGAIIAGYETNGGDRSALLVKIDGSGNESWKKNFGGTGDDQFSSIVRTSDGGYVVVGRSSSSNGDLAGSKGNYDGWAMKVDASGNKQWSMNYGGSGEDYLSSVTTTSDGNLVAVGSTKSNNGDIPSNRGGYEAWIIKFEGSTGAKSWVKTYGGVNEEYMTAVAVNSSGNIMVLGHSNSTTGDVSRTDNDFGGWLLKLDASGNKAGASTYGSRPDDFTSGLITTQDGGYLVTGHTDLASTGRGYDAWILKIGSF